jgi:Rrf2 family iron-sulfur cluster assembly transcriptional regulator
MFLTAKARYAVMAMVDIALYTDSGRPSKLEAISIRQGIDKSYLEQIFVALRRKGLVNSVKGPGGGYKLTKDLTKISVAEILIAVEENTEMTRCARKEEENRGCMANGAKCLTHHLWVALGQNIEQFFQQVTLADICEGKHSNHAISNSVTKEQKNNIENRVGM